MALPPGFIEELRARIRLSEVVGRRVKLIRRGREHTGLCPFHNEKTPSFTVSDDKGFYYCFGCGAKGDAIDFEMKLGGFDFRETVERLAGEVGLTVPAEDPDAKGKAERREVVTPSGAASSAAAATLRICTLNTAGLHA